MSHIDSQKNKIPLLKYPERWISFALCPSKIGETRFHPREPASSLAKSSSRSSVRSSSSSSFGIRRRFGRAGSPFVDPAGDSAWTRGEQAPTIHHATTTNPIRPTKRTEREAAGQRSTWPNSLWNERRVKEREKERGEGWLFSRVFEHPERTRATVSKGPWKRRRGTNWYLWEFYATRTPSLSFPLTIKFCSTRFRDIWWIWKVWISWSIIVAKLDLVNAACICIKSFIFRLE